MNSSQNSHQDLEFAHSIQFQYQPTKSIDDQLKGRTKPTMSETSEKALNLSFALAKKYVLLVGLTTVLAACTGNQPQTTTTVVTGGNSETELNALAAPAPLTNPNITTVTPAHGSTTASPTSSVTITFAQAPVKAVIEKAFSLTPGMYNTNPAQKLTLTSMCASRWRVRNPNINDLVVFTWDVYKTTQVGSGIVPGGADVYFQTVGGTETARVFVNGVQHSLKANNPSVCTGSTPSDVPGAVTGTKNWSTDGKTFTFQPTAPTNSSNTALNPGASYTSFLGLDKAQATTFTVGQQFKLLSVGTTSFRNDVTTDVTINGAGFNAQTAFFLQSNKLEVVSISDLKAVVRVPAGFLPSVYGLMAANPDGGRTTLYPAFTIQAGAEPRELDPENYYQSFVEGYVINYETKVPITGATISIPGLQVTTNSAGYYLMRGVPPGRQVLKIEAGGYEPVYRIAEVNGSAQSLTMKTAALELLDTNTTLIGPAGGTHNASNGAFLKIPPGALDKDVNIQFTHLRAAATLPELPQDGSYLAFAHLGPTGLVFKKPATLYLPLQPGIVIPVGQRINIFYYDARQAKWVDDITSGVISNINGKLFLEYEINHFTWIGGSWRPDPVNGCVVNERGERLTDISTNWGTTDAAGNFKGSTTQSDSGLTLNASATLPDGSQTAAVSTYYSGNGEVTFPSCIIYKDAEPSATPFKYSEQNTQSEISPFAESATCAAKTLKDTSEICVFLTKNLRSIVFPIKDWKAGNLDVSTIQVYFRGQEVTKFSQVNILDESRLEVVYTTGEPFKAGLNAALTIKAYTKPSTSKPKKLITLSETIHLVAKFGVTQTVFVPEKYIADYPVSGYPTEPTAISDKGKLVVFYPYQQPIVNFTLRVPIGALDEDNAVLPVSFSSVNLDLDSSTTGVTAIASAPMTNGLSFPRLTFNAQDPTTIKVIAKKNGLLVSSDAPSLGALDQSIKPKFVFAIPLAVQVFVGAAAAIEVIIQSQQGALAIPPIDFIGIRDWFSAEAQSIQAQATATAGAVIIVANAIVQPRAKPIVLFAPTTVDCLPKPEFGSGNRPTQDRFDQKDPKLNDLGSRAQKGIDRKWLDEADLICRFGQGTGDWNANQLKAFEEAGKLWKGGNGSKAAALRKLKDAGIRGAGQSHVGQHINCKAGFMGSADDPRNIILIPNSIHKLKCHNDDFKNCSTGDLFKPFADLALDLANKVGFDNLVACRN
jgi:Carboxypeptidase regulatory-like domain